MSGGTIQARALACQRLFTQCLSLTHTEHMSWFELRRGEFNIWAYGLQALSSGKSSLDYRVRNRSDVGGIILALLGGLSEDLEDCIKNDRKLSIEGTDGVVAAELNEQDGEDLDFVDFSDDEDTSKSKSSASEEGIFSIQMYNIRTVIAQLTRFSSMIRRSGTKFRFKRADSTLALRESEFDDFKEHLTSMILIRSINFDVGDPKSFEVFQDKIDPDLLTPVQRRLIHGNVLRRNRIIDATKNMRLAEREEKGGLKKPTHDWKFVVPDMKAKVPTPTPIPQSQAAKLKTGGTVKSSANSKVESTARSATEIGSQLGLQVAPPKAAPSVITKVTKIGVNQDYPKCPKPISDDFIQCPYCADMLPAEYRNSSSRWRGHVAQDILPYMCIYEQCSLADEMYLTSEELISHVRDHHSTKMWACNFCLPKASEAETYVFESSIQWQEHVLQAHRESIPEQQISSLARISERQMIQAVSCPLCAYTPAGAQTTVDQHILRHLHEFALRCLPPGADHGAEGSVSDNSVGGLSTETDVVDSGEEEPQVFTLDNIQQELVLLDKNLLELTRELGVLDFKKLPAGIFDDHDIRKTCAVIGRNAAICSETHKKFRSHLRRRFPGVGARLQMMLPAANESLRSLLPTLRGNELSFSDLYTNLLLPLMIEVEFIVDEEQRRGSRVYPLHDPSPIVKKFDLTLPWKQTPSSTQYDTHVIKEIEDFVFGKQNGFLALLDGEVDRALSAVSHFARQSQEKYLGLRLFHIDFDDTQFGSVKSIGDLDRVFAQIATDLLEMPDLLHILVDADRGSGLVECILRTANERAKARWILIIDNITIPIDTFLRHDVTQGDYIRWPNIPVQGSVIMTSSKQPQLPEGLDVYSISQEPAPPQSLYEDANADFKFDYILTSGEFSRLRLQPSGRSGPRDPSAERWRPMLNLVRPTPPSSPVPESSVALQNDIVIEYDENPETRCVSPETKLPDHVQPNTNIEVPQRSLAQAQTMSSQKSVGAYIEDVDSDDNPIPDTRKSARSKQEPNTSRKKSSSSKRSTTTSTISPHDSDATERQRSNPVSSGRPRASSLSQSAFFQPSPLHYGAPPVWGGPPPLGSLPLGTSPMAYHGDYFGGGARPEYIPNAADRLASRFEARPRSSMGSHGSSFEDPYADFEAPSPHARPSPVIRKPSLSKRTTKNDEDRRQMPPPPRPSTAGPRQHFRPPPPPSQRNSVGFNQDEFESDGESDLFRGDAPHGIDFTQVLPVRSRRPNHARRLSLSPDFLEEGYSIEPAGPKTRRANRRSGRYSVEDKIHNAADYQTAQDAIINTATAPLTPENLHRLENSASDHDGSSFRKSETTKATSPGSNDDVATTKVPSGAAVVEYDGIRIKAAKGGEITLGRDERSDRGPIHSDELRTHTHRTEKSGTRPNPSSQGVDARSPHARRPRAIMSPNPHAHGADDPDIPIYDGVYNAYPPYDNHDLDGHFYDI